MSELFRIFVFFADCNGLIVPQELPSVLSLVYSNIPPVKKGTDSRVGFGFRLGEHADFQVLFELGPQKFTKPLGIIWNLKKCLYWILLNKSILFIGKGFDDGSSDTSKRMVDQSDYEKKVKVSWSRIGECSIHSNNIRFMLYNTHILGTIRWKWKQLFEQMGKWNENKSHKHT